jgi:hypothetical protein
VTLDYDELFVDTLLFGSKFCRTCRIAKPKSSEHFDRDASNDDGLHAECKPCRRERQLANPRQDNEARAAGQRERYQSDPEYREARKAMERKRRRAAA